MKCKDCGYTKKIDYFWSDNVKIILCNRCYNDKYITVIPFDETSDAIEHVKLENVKTVERKLETIKERITRVLEDAISDNITFHGNLKLDEVHFGNIVDELLDIIDDEISEMLHK